MKSLQLRGLKVQTWPCVFMKMLENAEGTGGALPFRSSPETRWLPAAAPEGCCSCVSPLSRAASCTPCRGGWERGAQASSRCCSQVIRETSYRQEPKVSVQTSHWGSSHVSWDRTLHAELGGGGFRAVCHKLGTRVLRVNET